LVINNSGPAIDKTCFPAGLLHASYLLLKLPREPIVIGIEWGDVFPAGFPYRSIPGGAHSRIALANEVKSGIPCHEFLHDGTGRI
jgi:hypothetical protein